MENNDKTGDDLGRWIDDRLAALRPDSQWQPDLSRGLARLKERRISNSARHRRRVWIIPFAVAACLPLMALPATREFARRCVSACVNQSNFVGRLFIALRSPSTSSAYINPRNREMAPDFTLNDATGKPVRLSEVRGKVVLLNFRATWCPPCNVDMPWFGEFQQTYRDRDFTVLGVSLDEKGWSAVNPYVEANHISYRMVVGTDDVSRLYGGLEVLPVTLIIDRFGRIAAHHVGQCSKSEYQSDVQAVLDEQ